MRETTAGKRGPSNLWRSAPLLFPANNLNVLDHSGWRRRGSIPEDVELRRKDLFHQLENLGDSPPGHHFRELPQVRQAPTCACARADHPVHGPQIYWNVSIGGKTQARNLPLGRN